MQKTVKSTAERISQSAGQPAVKGHAEEAVQSLRSHHRKLLRKLSAISRLRAQEYSGLFPNYFPDVLHESISQNRDLKSLFQTSVDLASAPGSCCELAKAIYALPVMH